MINNRSDFERGSTNTLNKMKENKFSSRLTMLLSVLKLYCCRLLELKQFGQDENGLKIFFKVASKCQETVDEINSSSFKLRHEDVERD